MIWHSLKGMNCPKVLRNCQFLMFFKWNRALATVSCTFCRPHLQKVVRTCQFLTIYMWNCNLAHILSTSSSKSGPNLSVLDDFLGEIELSLLSRAHFVDLIFKKWSEPVSAWRFFRWNRALATVSRTFCRPHLQKVVRTVSAWRFIMWNRALATVSCTFCRPLSGSRRAPAETETLQRRPRTATLPEKNTGFCARECFQPWIHIFPIAHTSQLLDDDVIDMMMWLTWWCELMMMIEMIMWLPWWWDSYSIS